MRALASSFIVFSSSVSSFGSSARASAASASAIIVPSRIVRIDLRLPSSLTVHRTPLLRRPSGGGVEERVAARGRRDGGRAPPRSFALVLERHLHLGAIGEHLAALELHVELRHLGDAEIAQRLRGALDRGPGRLLPRVRAGADQLDDLVHALRHGWLLSGLLGGGALRGGRLHSPSSPPRTARPHPCRRRCTW